MTYIIPAAVTEYYALLGVERVVELPRSKFTTLEEVSFHHHLHLQCFILHYDTVFMLN